MEQAAVSGETERNRRIYESLRALRDEYLDLLPAEVRARVECLGFGFFSPEASIFGIELLGLDRDAMRINIHSRHTTAVCELTSDGYFTQAAGGGLRTAHTPDADVPIGTGTGSDFMENFSEFYLPLLQGARVAATVVLRDPQG